MMVRWVAAIGFVLAMAVRAESAEPPLQALAIEHVGPDQGVFVDAEDGSVLASVVADRAVHPASVTKVATSLALLERLGPAHRFETRVGSTGTLRDGRLQGDLIVHGGNDPFFVYESAFLVLRELHERGIRRIGGRLRITGSFLLNWQPDPTGSRLGAALRGRTGAAAWTPVSHGLLLERAALRFDDANLAGGDEQPLVTHRSPPLLHVVKALNGFSNNVFHYASDTIGGPHAVQAIAREHVPPELRDGIIIDNGAGGGSTNRLSPRAAVVILRALDRYTKSIGHGLVDVMPVSGVDPGTLRERLLDRRRYVVGKTGTFGSVGACALVGLVRSRKLGTVAFAVLNHNVPVPEARKRQDTFVRALLEAVDAEPWPYDTPTKPTYTLAAVD
jgi:D-alanyl-D-alanine carboxypeptidase/D-alanyl-D-alanine-endopeptidase (penicillin-binding protein 4)